MGALRLLVERSELAVPAATDRSGTLWSFADRFCATDAARRRILNQDKETQALIHLASFYLVE